MPPFGPVSRRDLIFFLKKAGFTGPFAGGRHQYVIKGAVRIWVPNPHSGDIGVGLLLNVIKQAELSRDEWEKL